MTTEELAQLEYLLKKYYLETKGTLGLEKIKPCLYMVQEKLALIGGGYNTK